MFRQCFPTFCVLTYFNEQFDNCCQGGKYFLEIHGNLSVSHGNIEVLLDSVGPCIPFWSQFCWGKEETLFLTSYCEKVQKVRCWILDEFVVSIILKYTKYTCLAVETYTKPWSQALQLKVSSSSHWDLWRLTSGSARSRHIETRRHLSPFDMTIPIFPKSDLCFPNHQSFPEWIG